MSETSTGKLAEALAKAQAAMEAAAKDRTNPAFKSKYADLTSVWDACRAALTSNGLAVAQIMVSAPEGFVAVETRLLHTSGESLSSVCTLPATKKDAQGYGSAITYARRYGLSAMVGVVADDDDDGNAASGRATPPPRPAQQNQGDAVEKEKAALRALFATTGSVADLDALWERVKRLPNADVAEITPDFVARKKALKATKPNEDVPF